MKIKTAILFCLLVCSIAIGQASGQETMGPGLAKSYFGEVASLCALDSGKLWGINLYGPIMLANPENRQIIANQQDNNNSFVEQDNVFVGKLPADINMANTSFEWGGINWTMVRWDALQANDNYSRDKLLIHECWHRNQDKFGIKPAMTANAHLDEAQGAILLKLEFMALKNAIQEGVPANQILHLQNALTIRKLRQLLFPGNNENDFERHEGMAEYTGYKLCGIDQNMAPVAIAKQLELSMDKEGLANSFAYITGPAYGYLFDGMKKDWLADIRTGKSLPDIGLEIIKGDIANDTANLKAEVSKIITGYNAEPFIKAETEKFDKEKIQVNAFKQKFTKGRQLIIPNNGLNFSFNPQEKLITIDGIGVIYKTMRITGEWGILEVKNGILRSNDWQLFIVSAPTTANSGNISEPDYNLNLNKGWEAVMIKEGKYTLKKL
jgi:hypothetical protein